MGLLKRRLFNFFLLAVLLPFPTVSVHSQTLEPEYVGDIVSIDANSTTAVELEKVTPTQEVTTDPLAFVFALGGAKAFMSIDGTSSPVRFVSGSKLSFMIRVKDQRQNPLQQIQFFRTKSKDGKRILPLAEGGGLLKLGNVDNTLKKYLVPFVAKKYKTDFFIFSSQAALSRGEYLLSCDVCPGGFAFGVD